MKIVVYNQKGEKTGMAELPEKIFGLKWNADLVHQVVEGYRANERRQVARAKDRSEVSGGGRKPWRQKGTGRARHGSIRSPLWKGGGVTHGPVKEKKFKKKINKKMAKKALYVVLSAKAKNNEVVLLDSLHFVGPKTKFAAEVFKNFSRREEFKNLAKGSGVLVVFPKKEEDNYRALRNLPYASAEEARNLNAYKTLRYRYILFLQKAIEFLP